MRTTVLPNGHSANTAILNLKHFCRIAKTTDHKARLIVHNPKCVRRRLEKHDEFLPGIVRLWSSIRLVLDQ